MGVGSEEQPGAKIERKHDPGLEALINPKRDPLEALINPNFSPRIKALFAQVQTGGLDPEQAYSRIIQMLTETASRDLKTGLLLKEAVELTLKGLMEYCQKHRIPLTIVYLDANGFKKINDHPELGHDVGDEVIKIIAKTIKETTRGYDIQARLSEEAEQEDGLNKEGSPARVGGDEFLIVLPEASAVQAIKVVGRFQEKLYERIESDVPKIKAILGFPLKVSAGIIQYNPEIDRDPTSMIKRAEQAMYRSKKGGYGIEPAYIT